MLNEIKNVKKSLILNGMKGAEASGKDSSQLSFQTVKTNLKDGYKMKEIIRYRKLKTVYLKECVMFQPKQAANFGSFGHVVLALETRIEEGAVESCFPAQ